MGSNSSSGGGGGGNNKTYSSSREIGLMNQYKPEKKKKTVTGFDRKTGKKYSYETTVNQRAIDTQKDKNKAFKEQGAYNTRRSLDKLPSLLPGAAILKGLSEPLQKNSIKNRKFFTDKVLTDPRGKKNFGYTKSEFEKLSMAKQNEIYGNYITTRRDNKTDGYGTVIKEGNDNQVVQAPLVATTMPVGIPTEVEISQSEATQAKEDDILLRKRKAKARGRSPTIMTGVTGATGSLTLGKPSLLGR
jgi:hypothetical protein